MSRGNLQRAASRAEQCISKQSDPPLVECYLLAGDAYARQNKEQQAQRAVERYATFLRLAPGHPSAPAIRQKLRGMEARQALLQGTRLFWSRHFDDALARARQCLQQVPDDADCELLEADVLVALREPDKAVDHYRRLLELAPDHPQAPRAREAVATYESRYSQR